MKGVLLFVLLATACAWATPPGDQPQGDAHAAVDAPPGKLVDAPPGHLIDAPHHAVDAAPVMIDAHVTPDAAPLSPDASTDGNFCTQNSQCTDHGECCLKVNGVGICTEGDLIGSTCLPPF